ncbi:MULTISPECIES: M28 family metallopeptidase [Streptomyces]|uniref:Aminopeptidase n=1 Tax=Streptomyces viridosporus (strain ATCC 14672 / DSM 40746 / JCM 4963 / KCTC 9882 / NRRL B-12104 / FH 1290) TaxID=566461 RepID=D6A5E2_STRV1|nr:MULTISPECIES: M28 family metallopeptidase [Streptomyces]EFE71654.1 aminopeptidase [Streptomyces viridosporus ATCC 14672]PWJ04004.1 amidohydrolase [Streptomyces sp. NWU49]
MNARNRRTTVAAVSVAGLITPLLLIGSGTASAHSDPAKEAAKLAKKLVKKSDAKDAHEHLTQFQRIADRNGNNRVAGSEGHRKSAEYVEGLLRKAGYSVTRNEFDFPFTETLAQSLRVVSPQQQDVPVIAMTYSANSPVGGTTAPVAVVPVDDTTGCEPGDYASETFTGKIALIKRGGCSFAEKQEIAAGAGAVGAIIYNNTEGALNGTLGDPSVAKIPAGGITQADGEALAAKAAAGTVTVNLEIRTFSETRRTYNVIAETKGGAADNVVMFGAHLDSVADGPGINDNGSGSAGILEVALNLAHEKTKNKVRFAWWSAEEFGLLGSEAYVDSLSAADLAKIKLYLNFDMIASPNYAQFVYDGDDSDQVGAGPGPEGSAQLERQITDYLDRRGTPYEGTDFTGRSDYGPFIEVGIPSGGTFTGAEGVKTAEQAKVYGGKAGVAYDACYHAACDNLKNINMKAFDVNIDVIANAAGQYAWDTSLLSKPVAPRNTEGSAGSGGGLHEGHDHEVTE